MDDRVHWPSDSEQIFKMGSSQPDLKRFVGRVAGARSGGSGALSMVTGQLLDGRLVHARVLVAR